MPELTLARLAPLRLLLEGYAYGELPEFESFARTITEVQLRTGRDLIIAGEPHPYVYFVLQGLLHVHDGKTGGQRRTFEIVEENQFAASLSALGMAGVKHLFQTGFDRRNVDLSAAAAGLAKTTTTALEPTVLLRLDFGRIERLSRKSAAWGQLLINFLVAQVLHLEEDNQRARYLSTEERFRLLLQERPSLVERAKRRDLASYLGVTPVGLGRIMARVADDQASAPEAPPPRPIEAVSIELEERQHAFER